MEQLHSGQYLIYRHLLNIFLLLFNNNNKDNFTLIIYGFRGGIENLIKINILINLFEPSKLLNVHHFPQELFLVSGGTLQLNSNLISTSHSILSDSSIFYKIIQTPQNGVNFIFKEEGEVINNKSFSSFPLILNFTQEDINKGFIWLEHNLINEKQLWNVIGIQLTTFVNEQLILDSGKFFFVLNLN
ncbi:hypothetical protein Mgra_00008756 [Meloidogyne graminicola]|uniref:Uncharacterized protein n=1 Tax=Meloidogyne graminicola TaxID=189291 RepID=A0A8S9ZEV6_9BILA|nr:hypothetical protein Mgra_00008756 [Meloidogyne graminicola]